MSDIKTTPEMDIKHILRVSDNPAGLYAAQRIEELENLLATHEPYGHNVTNLQYTEVLAERDQAKAEAAVMQEKAKEIYKNAENNNAPDWAKVAWDLYKNTLSSTAGQNLLDQLKTLTDLYHTVESWFKAGQPKALSEEWDDLNNAFNIAHFALKGGDTNAS